MSGLPVLLEGEAIEALVVGGGEVGMRKALALWESGATVRVVAPRISDALREAALHSPRLQLAEREYESGDIGAAQVVVAATDRREVNTAVSEDAHRARRLVNVADAPNEGNFVTAATHRAGPLVIGVSAGGVPSAARAVRDAIAARFDARYMTAIEKMGGLRQRLLASGRGAEWKAAADSTATDFCALVESGELARQVDAWP